MTPGVFGYSPHLLIWPILLPMFTAAIMLLLGEKRRAWKALVNLASCLVGLGIAIALLRQADLGAAPGATFVYLAGNWQAPYGISLAADRLSALMLVLAGIISTATVVFAIARWDRGGVHFHPLFQIQLMGLNGAFLTADLFNLFVFFEVLLAASYGLLLHGSGRERVQAGLHYIAINLVASSMFLVGAALIYGVTGTLNLADIAQRIAGVAPEDRGLLHAGAAMLGVAYLTKAGMWPLGFWLVPAYSAATPPVGALFSMMTKVGIYVVLRLWMLVFPDGSGPSASFGGQWIVGGGLLTLAFGSIGMLSANTVPRLASYSLVVSSGLLLAALGFGDPIVTGGALFYLLSSTLGVSAMFMLAELITRARLLGDANSLDEDKHLAFPNEDAAATRRDSGLEDADDVTIGQAIPAAWAFLGLSFIVCVLLITGMPPLSGFIGKFALLSGLLSHAPSNDPATGWATARWIFFALIIASGFASLLALVRIGIRYFWGVEEGPPPRLRVMECGPIAALMLTCALLTVLGEPVVRYTREAAESLSHPSQYIDAVMSARPPARTGVQGGAMKRLFPSPVLSVALFLLWLVLNPSLSPAQWLMALGVGVVVPLATVSMRPGRVSIRRPGRILALVGHVVADVFRSNRQVLRAVLRSDRTMPTGSFVKIPLALHDPNGLAALAMITCLTPGSIWTELSQDRTVLLIHVLDMGDEARYVENFKARYEAPLIEIFQ